ncbi:hypothetical protein WN51_13846 [Melipona quadrifasciata]|uniref:Uncharacterized protein n=1 Tax=Melipona quadrifasciata TaxID=166423 RepID=A0A0N0BFS4_9HYME|nr:hypothetical protein WN51_13846 [Melipona quadrifasciata]
MLAQFYNKLQQEQTQKCKVPPRLELGSLDSKSRFHSTLILIRQPTTSIKGQSCGNAGESATASAEKATRLERENVSMGSFIRAYVLDNVCVCVLMHVLFYVALWYATTVIRRMERANKEMLKIMEENRTRLEDVVALKDKKGEYDEVVVKAVSVRKKLLNSSLRFQMRRLSTELINAEGKLSELERVVKKCMSGGKSCGNSAGDVADRENEHAGPCLGEGRARASPENLKVGFN